ncbi:hypothetical protein [Sporosarcina obsidiansis]|uniref:hypothetical protein n=1 Tax=Sporosarcina obsidiansis TaxID=2660748 RepID=UPI00129ADB83|nr:hypothetical protein [Sporosarcina obsidiansis]
MKKQIISTLGALMLTTGALHGVNVEASQPSTSHQSAAISHYQGGYQHTASIDITTLPEYEMIATKVDVTGLNFGIVTDQPSIRKMLLNDAKGRTQYKTIYNKTTKHLKIINTRGGLVFNQVITEQPADQVQKPTKPAVKPATPEYEALSAKVDLTGYKTRVVEDNHFKRITLFSDSQNRVQYKTIFFKRTDAVKIIRL